MEALAQLPWDIQLVLVSGYCAYVIAYGGRRSAHTPTDTFAIILAFGGLALLDLEFLDGRKEERGWARALLALHAFLLCCVLGALWRAHIGRWVRLAIGKLTGTHEDGLNRAWDTVVQDPHNAFSQLNVTLKSGRILECYPLSQFSNEPSGPCVFGGDGSIAMYVTHIQEAETRRESNLLRSDEGIRMTYIPQSEIAEVDFRLQKKTSV